MMTIQLTHRKDVYDSKKDEWDLDHITMASGSAQSILNALYSIHPDMWYEYYVTEFDESENVLNQWDIEEWVETVEVKSTRFDVSGQICGWSVNPHTNGLRWHVQNLINDASQWMAISV